MTAPEDEIKTEYLAKFLNNPSPMMRAVTIDGSTIAIQVPNTINNSRYPDPTIKVAVVLPWNVYQSLIDRVEELEDASWYVVVPARGDDE